MKIWKLVLAAAAALVVVSLAHAQNAGTVTSGAFAIGKGVGQTGFTSLQCGSAQLAVGQSAAAPICRTMGGDATLAADGTLTISNNVVSNAKLRDSGGLSVIGRSANSSGDPADISCAGASDGVLRESGSVLGCGTVATGGIANNAVTDAKLRQSGALSLIGRSANSSGNVADIFASAGSSCAFRENGNSIGCGTLATSAYANNSVTNAKLAQMADGTIKSNVSGGSADPSDNSISSVLDKLFGTTQGSVVYRGASSWATLAPGTSGQFFKTQGGGADPVWASVPGGGDMLAANNLSDVASAATAFGNIKQLATASATGVAKKIRVAHIQDQKTVATEGGDFNSGSWITRNLNAEVSDADAIVTVSSNRFTLSAGTYVILWDAPAYRVGLHKTRLFNFTDTAAVAFGVNMYADPTSNGGNSSSGFAFMTIAGSKTFEIQHRCATTKTTDGLGNATNVGVIEVYANVIIVQIDP